jgi:hypothetical protein
MTETSRFPDNERDVDADHLVETPESLRDGDPETPPMDRGSEASDRPLGAEKHGTTHAEAEEGESLDGRLAEEVPDVGERDPVDDVVADHPETFAQDAADAEQTDESVLEDAYAGSAADDPVGPGQDAGRLVEPDEGAHTDTEKDVVARDVGLDGGDLSAEEAAVHIEEEQ